MHYLNDSYSSFGNTICLCGCSAVEREGKKEVYMNGNAIFEGPL